MYIHIQNTIISLEILHCHNTVVHTYIHRKVKIKAYSAFRYLVGGYIHCQVIDAATNHLLIIFFLKYLRSDLL